MQRAHLGTPRPPPSNVYMPRNGIQKKQPGSAGGRTHSVYVFGRYRGVRSLSEEPVSRRSSRTSIRREKKYRQTTPPLICLVRPPRRSRTTNCTRSCSHDTGASPCILLHVHIYVLSGLSFFFFCPSIKTIVTNTKYILTITHRFPYKAALYRVRFPPRACGTCITTDTSIAPLPGPLAPRRACPGSDSAPTFRFPCVYVSCTRR